MQIHLCDLLFCRYHFGASSEPSCTPRLTHKAQHSYQPERGAPFSPLPERLQAMHVTI
jgi:hypothetical protein